MEKPHKIVFSIVAVLLYLLASSGFSDGISHRIQVDQNIEPTGTHFFWAEELPFVSGFAVKDGAGLWSGGNPAPVSNKQPQLFKAVVFALEEQVAITFLQNISQFNTNPVRIRKSDMLFPFHYFFEPARA